MRINPCRCGSRKQEIAFIEWCTNGTIYWVHCSECKRDGDCVWNSEVEAIDRWNLGRGWFDIIQRKVPQVILELSEG